MASADESERENAWQLAEKAVERSMPKLRGELTDRETSRNYVRTCLPVSRGPGEMGVPAKFRE